MGKNRGASHGGMHRGIGSHGIGSSFGSSHLGMSHHGMSHHGMALHGLGHNGISHHSHHGMFHNSSSRSYGRSNYIGQSSLPQFMIMNGQFYYSGNSIAFQSALSSQKMQTQQIRNANILITGQQITEANYSLLICICILGACLLFPFILLCFDCVRRKLLPVFSVPVTTYGRLQQIINRPNLVSLALTVEDHTFDQEKARLLYEMLSRSLIKGFTFHNSASFPFDYNKKQWSNFSINMRPIKQLPIVTHIRWSNQILM